MKQTRLATVGAVCAIVTVIGFVVGIVLSVSSGVQVLIPETGAEGSSGSRTSTRRVTPSSPARGS